MEKKKWAYRPQVYMLSSNYGVKSGLPPGGNVEAITDANGGRVDPGVTETYALDVCRDGTIDVTFPVTRKATGGTLPLPPNLVLGACS